MCATYQNEGGDLRAFLSAGTDPLENPLPQGLARDIAKGMQFLHSKNAIHGDLKSPNVLLTGDKRAKVSTEILSSQVLNSLFTFFDWTSRLMMCL